MTIYRLLSTQQSLSLGDFTSLEEAWAAVKQHKGRMILWKMTLTPEGYIWRQQPLKFIPFKDRVIFHVKSKWKSFKDSCAAKLKRGISALRAVVIYVKTTRRD